VSVFRPHDENIVTSLPATRPGSAGTRLRRQAVQEERTASNRTCEVGIGPGEGGGFELAVKIRVEDKTFPQVELAALAREAHEKICPCSHATRGNVNVELEVSGA